MSMSKFSNLFKKNIILSIRYKNYSTLNNYAFVKTMRELDILYVKMPITKHDIDMLELTESGGNLDLKTWLENMCDHKIINY